VDACSDLEPGVYEGGLKVWECSLDLVALLHSTAGRALLAGLPEPPGGRGVLELGCGHALPGIAAYATLLECCAVPPRLSLCDFNAETFPRAALPNLLRKLPAADLSRVRCLAGDWLGLPAGEHELVVASETTYSRESCAATALLLGRHLRPGGVALVAGKRHYFGVGGGSGLFLEEAGRRGRVEGRTWVMDDGRSNIREIIEVRKAQQN
jgi:hypothetical protein